MFKYWDWILAALLILTFAVAAVGRGQDVIVDYAYVVPPGKQGGGNMAAYAKHVYSLNQAGVQVIIPKGGCSSSCTFYLAADKVCVHPQTILEFHGPMTNGVWAMYLLGIPVPHHGFSEAEHRDLTRKMAAIYDQRWPGLGDWFLDRAAHKFGLSVTKLTGQSIHNSFGVPLCEG